ncbi:MAG: tetratricopeptide repeat protein [Verrucomicrobiae bacterium]|nr:tetratricopeptide repeat protein [Verrucomicrobiae bacterium]
MIKSENELPADLKTLYKHGLNAAEKDNFDYAIEILQNLLEREPRFLKARQKLRSVAAKKSKGQSRLKQLGLQPKIQYLAATASPKKDPVKAMVTAEQILALDPFCRAGADLLFESATTLNMPEIAAFALEAYKEGSPTDKEVLFKLANLYMSLHEGEKAAQAYQAILKIQPTNSEAIKGIKDATAQSTINRGGWEGAKSHTDVQKDKGESKTLEAEGRLVRTEEQIHLLLEENIRRVQQEPQNINLYRTLAELYYEVKDYDNSLAYYKHVFEQTGSVDAAIQRKMMEIRVRRYNKWIKEREDYITAYPHNPDCDQYHQEIGDYKLERDAMVLRFAEEQVAKYPTDLGMRFDLAEAYFKLGRLDDAQREFQRAQANPSKRLQTFNYLGLCFSAKGMPDMALTQFVKAAEEIPTMDGMKKEILYNMGLEYEKMERKVEALDCFKQIYQVDLSYKDVKQRVEAGYQ